MFAGFSPQLFRFLDELKRNNNRDWFAKNKSRYEDVVLFPTMEFVTAMEKPLKKVSPCFQAIPKRVGGSVLRIYRDTRFSKDKTPYKTNVGMHFRHQVGKDIHAPGFYFHIDAKEIFVGAGVWHPDNPSLNKIRVLIDDDPARWKRIKGKKAFKDEFEVHGDSLKRPPKGYEADHPLIDDLKRKDHIVLTSLKRTDLYSTETVELVAKKFKTAMPYVRFLCDALHIPS
jgi:uncharacterized protein (TIGR02453 family)